MDFFLLKLRLRFGRLDLVTHMLDFAEGLAREERRKWVAKSRRRKGWIEKVDDGFLGFFYPHFIPAGPI